MLEPFKAEVVGLAVSRAEEAALDGNHRGSIGRNRPVGPNDDISDVSEVFQHIAGRRLTVILDPAAPGLSWRKSQIRSQNRLAVTQGDSREIRIYKPSRLFLCTHDCLCETWGICIQQWSHAGEMLQGVEVIARRVLAVETRSGELMAEQHGELALEKGVRPTARAQLAVETQGSQAMKLGNAVVGRREEVRVQKFRGMPLRELDQGSITPPVECSRYASRAARAPVTASPHEETVTRPRACHRCQSRNTARA